MIDISNKGRVKELTVLGALAGAAVGGTTGSIVGVVIGFILDNLNEKK